MSLLDPGLHTRLRCELMSSYPLRLSTLRRKSLLNLQRSQKSKHPSVHQGSKHKTKTDDEDDLGGFGPEEDHLHQPGKTSLSMTEAGRSSAKRTGDRDDRGDPCFHVQVSDPLTTLYIQCPWRS
jgi:hypothetical protein